MGLLSLTPEIQQHILSLPDTVRQSTITERALRPVARLDDLAKQTDKFQVLLDQIL